MGQQPINDAIPEAPARPRRSSSHARIGLLALLVILFFGSLIHPVSRCYHPAVRLYSHWRPTTADGDRVHKILSETPLIGIDVLRTPPVLSEN